METFAYRLKEGKACVVGYSGMEEHITVPSVLDDFPVGTIGKKAFWGNRTLRSIRLPDTIEKIEGWAFAGCKELLEVRLPENSEKELVLEGHIFQNCSQLRYIRFGAMEEALSRLLACAVTKLGADYLLDYSLVGSEKWYQSLDARLLQVLEEPEETALRNLVYCAEEDMLEKQQKCLYRQSCDKAELAFLRLSHPEKLAFDVYERLKNYILQRNKGCQSEEAWEVFVTEHMDRLLYCDTLFQIGGIHSENIDLILQSLDDSQVELKAYILQKWQKQSSEGAVWDFLSLDDNRPEEEI